MYSFAQNRPGPDPIHNLNPAEAHESQLTDLECIFEITNNDAHTLSTTNQKSNISAHLCKKPGVLFFSVISCPEIESTDQHEATILFFFFSTLH